MTRKIDLLVNDLPVDMDYFVQSFIDHTVSGMLEALEGTGPVQKLDLSIDGDKVFIKLDGTAVPINPFVTKITKNTIRGMVSSLKGVDTTNKIKLNMSGTH